ncbi:hypothetical protein H6F67_01810 [Microcoleus sp. FACHB-1515]|uniref:hypothetical protein n=1 Tax=Cyanophyceae TaxID=3028117 RepID=UPI00168981CA|nr:hypothetical protein [Microcoleus sp. FACHB-1515]MBD2088597.1 hypothetical protein [Microcoleus sp. FACHB-1515]
MEAANPSPLRAEAQTEAASQTFSEAWAKKYLQKLAEQDDIAAALSHSQIAAEIAKTLMQSLRSTSAQAWAKTETLLAQEMVRHQIDGRLIDPWAIAKDAHQIYEIALTAYAQQTAPPKLSTLIASELGQIRHKYTADDPRMIGFVSMQFHYSEQMLLDLTPPTERSLLGQYFKVIDDHLYMPLQRAYQAAAQQDYHAPQLQAVRHLVPLCSEIAANIVARVLNLNPSYRSHSGYLNDEHVQISSIRDVEMFQVYLWVCVLENNISAIQQELFPLCVMLYPRLNVRWELVRQLIHLLEVEICKRLDSQQAAYFTPYYDALWGMFSSQVFPE